MSKNSILIVEDQRDIRQMLRYALETTGRDFHVMDVPSGEEGLLLLSRQKIHLMVVDIRLAGISGLELMEKARSRRPDLKVILITGIADPVMRQKIANAGADAYFYKPVPMADFLNTVDTCLGLAPVEKPGGIAEPAGESKPSARLAAILSDFRQDTGVISILLLDENNRALAQSGDLPAWVDQAGLFASLVEAMRANLQAAHRLDCSEPEVLLFLSGKMLDLYAATIHPAVTLVALAAPQNEPGQREAMLGSLPTVVDKIRDPAIEDYLRTQGSSRSAAMEGYLGQSEVFITHEKEILHSEILRFAHDDRPGMEVKTQEQEMLRSAQDDRPGMEVKAQEQEMLRSAQDDKPEMQTTDASVASHPPGQPSGEPELESQSAEAAAANVDEEHPDLDHLFQQGLDTKDIDTFWEALSDQDSENSLNQGMLSYEQARRLGLTPDDGE